MGANLLYYTTKITVDPENFHFSGMRLLGRFTSLYGPLVDFIDRTGTIVTPIRTASMFPMPAYRPITKTFEEICNERAQELLARADQLNARFYVSYSGGIDSTLMLVSLLKNATLRQKENIVVLLSDESIAENPNFYRDHIWGKLRTDSIEMFPYLLGTDAMFVGGEHNDQLFGSDMMGKLIVRFGPEIIQQLYKKETFRTFFGELLGDDVEAREFYLDLFERLKDAAPIPIVTNHDYLWWINFSLKWQVVFMRMLSRISPRNAPRIGKGYLRTRYDHFYTTDDFQLWSLNNPEKKIKDRWNTYKWPCKDIIYGYTGDAEYRDHKIKRGSLYSVLAQQASFGFIDDSMMFHRSLDLSKYYNESNDFAR